MKKLNSEEEFNKPSNQNISVPALMPALVPTEEADYQEPIVMHVMSIMTANDRESPSLKLQEYIELIDVVIDQLETRFDNPVLEALAALQSQKMSTAPNDFCTLHHKDPETVE